MTMFLVKLKDGDGNETTNLYHGCDCWEKFFDDTFSPAVQELEKVVFVVRRGTYAEQKTQVHDIAVAVSNMDCSGLSWSELFHLGEWFNKFGRRFGLLREFRENGIC